MRRFLIASVILFMAPSALHAKDVTLKWKVIKDAAKYELEVARDPDFKQMVFSKTLKTTSVVKDLSSGIYFLRVRGLDKDDGSGTWSRAFKLVVTAPVNPVASSKTPRKITYVAKAPEVDTTWKVKDKATGFKVSLLKDGKEVASKVTSQPKADFHPATPGDYKIAVSPGYDGYYGPAVTVQEVHVEQKPMVPPRVDMPTWKRYDSRHKIKMKWLPSPAGEAKAYVVKIYRADQYSTSGRAPASEPVTTFSGLKDNQVEVPPLPPGRYVAAVQAVSNDDSLSTATTIPLDVNRGKPVEFEKFDLSAGYGFTGVNFRSNIIEAGSYITSQSLGSSLHANGNLWFYDSPWGMRVGGDWNTFVANGSPITNSDLMIAAQYRYIPSEEGLRREIQPYLGLRAWTLPLVFANNGGTSNSVSELSSTLFGPVLGVDLVRPLSEKVALVGSVQLAFPVTSTKVGGDQLANLTLSGSDPSPKIQGGVKIAIPGNLRLMAMVGYEENEGKFNPFAGYPSGGSGGGPSGSPPPGAQDDIDIKYPTFLVGVETANDGSLFRSNTLTSPPPEIFSYFDFTTSFVVSPSNYNGTFVENTGNGSNGGTPNFSLNGAPGSLVNFEANGFFKNSHSGMRLAAGWTGFTYHDTNIVNPEFAAQWGYKPQTQTDKTGWNWENYLGMRLWRMPLMDVESNFFSFHAPQLLGPVDTFILTKGLGKGWSGRLLAEISTPLALTDKDSVIDHALASAPSTRAELAAIRALSPDFSFGLGLGFRMDQLQYVPSAAAAATAGDHSTAQITMPTYSLFGKYTF